MQPPQDRKDHPVVAAARKEWPIIFAAHDIHEISGGAFALNTIRDLRSKKRIPPKCFARSMGKKVIIHRDNFLDWWNTKLEAC